MPAFVFETDGKEQGIIRHRAIVRKNNSKRGTHPVKSSIQPSIHALLLLTVLTGLAASSAWAARQFITIGTGEVNGVPYHAGGAICSMVNAGRADHQIRCTITSTAGSIANIEALRRGERDFGFGRADLARQAWRGTGAFAERGAFGGLRVVAALHAETVTVVARNNAGIETVQDLRGKRINLGPAGSGERAALQVLFDALGWTGEDFASIAELDGAAGVDALCGGELDAILLLAGHPDNEVQSALRCGARLVPVSGPAVNRMVREAGHYNVSVIPGGTYPDVTRDIETYGVTSLLLSSTNTARETVYEVTRAMFERAGELQGWHRALTGLDAARMARGTRVIDVPLHPGAEMHYNDRGLMP